MAKEQISLEDRLQGVVRRIGEFDHNDTLLHMIEDNNGVLSSDLLMPLLRNVQGDICLPKAEYHIDFDIIVQKKASLQIAPGSKLVFGKNGGILSYGVLRAIGNAEYNILFHGEGGGEWKNITLATRGEMPSALEYCVIAGGTGRERSMSHIKRSWDIYQRYGGGIAVIATKPQIKNCIIKGCSAEIGGGIFCYESSVKIEGINVKDCTGSGIAIVRNSKAELTSCKVESNTGHDGAGIRAEDSEIKLEKCTVTKNNAGGSGGGIYINDSKTFITESLITLNTARNNGGGIYSEGKSHYPRLKIEFTDVCNNRCTLNGGGIYAFGTLLSLLDCKLIENASAKGGGIYLSKVVYKSEDERWFERYELWSDLNGLNSCTLKKNHALTNGGGIYLDDSSFALKNTKILENSAGISGGGIFIDLGFTVMNNNSIELNSAQDGAGVYLNYALKGVHYDMDGRYRLDASSNKVSRNTASRSGGGVYFLKMPRLRTLARFGLNLLHLPRGNKPDNINSLR